MAKRNSVFTDIYNAGIKAGRYPGRTKKAREWYRKMAYDVWIDDRRALMKNEIHFARKEIRPGFMYMYVYDAKWKDDLKYWDACPLVFPWRKTEKGFIGINLHYLPPRWRAKLMDELYSLASNDKYNDNTKLELSYDVLRAASKFKAFEPCIHQYLTSNVRSKLYKIPANMWDIALFLPLEHFQKASKEQVWADAKESVGEL